MQRKDILLRLWDTAYDEEGWYPPLRAALADVTVEQAQWKAEGKAAHTIWELVNHLLLYKERFLTRLDRTEFKSSAKTNEDTFLSTQPATDTEWQRLVQRMGTVHHEIRNKLAALADADLDQPLPQAPLGGQVLSLGMHDAYHTGQIIMIRKLQGSWPETRTA